MDAITTLLNNLSTEGVILTFLLFAVSLKFLWDLFGYIYDKLKGFFDIQSSKERQHEEIINSLNSLAQNFKEQKEQNANSQKKVDKISQQLDAQQQQENDLKAAIERQTNEISGLKGQISTLTERTQDSTRAYLIDKHHHFCYQVHGIDDMSMQDIERRFMYYKVAGGDTFIDGLVDEIRALPRLTPEGMSENNKKKED